MDLVSGVATGLAAGLHTATWGMYKDAVHEGFELRKYARSVLISGTIAPLLVLLAGLPVADAGDLVVLFGATYVLERALVEFHKTFLRREDQSKYFIPMQLAVRGRVVESPTTRLVVGAIVAAALLVLGAIVAAIDAGRSGPLSLAGAFLAGSLGGWLSAFGGAWKDAPIEGFEKLKFVRSPLLAGCYGVVLSLLTPSLLLIALAALGLTVATLETWKTFFFPARPRGKFAGKPIRHPHMFTVRRFFIPLYAGIWALLIGGFVLGL